VRESGSFKVIKGVEYERRSLCYGLDLLNEELKDGVIQLSSANVG
jgi:hypothetical protein